MRSAVGIDLGTTHSLVAYVDGHNRPRVLPADGGEGPLLASAVRYLADGTVEVGAAARRAAAHDRAAITSVKRLMGRGPGDLDAAERDLHPIEAASPALRLAVAGRAVSPVEVSAEILHALKRRAEAHLGAPLGGCVVTVPAYFDDAQRQATRDAGRLAGLDVVRLLAEPTAAALAYGLDHRRRGTFAVYDLGGGTFDLSILRAEEGVLQVVATAGDTRLGGDDMDRAVARHLVARAGAPASPDAFRAAVAAAREVREALSSAERASCALALPGGARVEVELARDELEALIRPIVERTSPPCLQALRDAGLDAARLDGVVLVGGATRTPLVRRHVRALFGQEPLSELDPDTVVALGAAVQADALERGGRDDLLLLDVIPLSLGVELMGGGVERLLLRNSTIPATAAQEFTTHADGQAGIVVHVVQGERELARDCRSLARFTLRGLPRVPAGLARVELTYTVDADGILAVTARELTTGLAQRVEVKPTYGLGEEEVEAMLIDGLEHADADAAARLLAEWRVEGERVLGALARAMDEDAALLEAGEREAIEERARGLAEAMRGDDPFAVKAWIDSLEAAARAFAERRVDAHVARALAGRRVEELGGK